MRRYVPFPLLAALAVVAAAAVHPSAAVATGPCGTGETRAAVTVFLQALSDRDPAAANAAFATEPEFQWYSATAPGARNGTAAYARTTLLSYFRARVSKREKMQVTKWNFISGRGPTDAGVNGYLVRRAWDLPPTRFGFKAGVRCYESGAAPRIFVWSMAAVTAKR